MGFGSVAKIVVTGASGKAGRAVVSSLSSTPTCESGRAVSVDAL